MNENFNINDFLNNYYRNLNNGSFKMALESLLDEYKRAGNLFWLNPFINFLSQNKYAPELGDVARNLIENKHLEDVNFNDFDQSFWNDLYNNYENYLAQEANKYKLKYSNNDLNSNETVPFYDINNYQGRKLRRLLRKELNNLNERYNLYAGDNEINITDYNDDNHWSRRELRKLYKDYKNNNSNLSYVNQRRHGLASDLNRHDHTGNTNENLVTPFNISQNISGLPFPTADELVANYDKVKDIPLQSNLLNIESYSPYTISYKNEPINNNGLLNNNNILNITSFQGRKDRRALREMLNSGQYSLAFVGNNFLDLEPGKKWSRKDVKNLVNQANSNYSQGTGYNVGDEIIVNNSPEQRRIDAYIYNLNLNKNGMKQHVINYDDQNHRYYQDGGNIDYTNDINGIVNVNSKQFKGLFGRWRLRKLLNDNPTANIFTGDLENGLYTSGLYDPDGFSRRDIRALRREAKLNWKKYTPQIRLNAGLTIDMNGNPVLTAKANALLQLGEYFMNQNNTTARWIVPDGSAYKGTYDTYDVPEQQFEDLLQEQKNIYQQGGTIGLQQSDKDEQLMLAALFGYIGLNPDAIQSQEGFTKAIYAVINAYSKAANGDEEEIKTYLNQEYAKAGEALVLKTNLELYKSIKKPGALKLMITGIILLQKQQGIKQAKMGTKLDYIKQLKNICPEGYEIEFRKTGGPVCPVCKKKNKTLKALEGNKIEKECKGGISKAMNGIKALMKCGGKVKKHEEGDKLEKEKHAYLKAYEKAKAKGDLAAMDSIEVNYGGDPDAVLSEIGYFDKDTGLWKEPGMWKKNPNKKDKNREQIWTPDRNNPRYKKKIKINQEGNPIDLPELVVEAKAPKRYYYSDRNFPFTDGYSIRSQVYYPAYPSTYGWRTYDFDEPIAGRVIYNNPTNSDTLYFTKENYKPIEYPDGFMYIGSDKDLKKAKNAFNKASKVKKTKNSDK